MRMVAQHVHRAGRVAHVDLGTCSIERASGDAVRTSYGAKGWSLAANGRHRLVEATALIDASGAAPPHCRRSRPRSGCF